MAHESIEVNLPLAKVYELLNTPTEFPRFLRNIDQVNKINSQTFEFVTAIGEKEFRWTTNIIDDLRNTRFAWITINGNLNQTGTIRFTPLNSGTRTRIDFSLDYRTFFGEPDQELRSFIEGIQEQLKTDLSYFKETAESGGFFDEVSSDKSEDEKEQATV
jgi:uncharacterized membrane protein